MWENEFKCEACGPKDGEQKMYYQCPNDDNLYCEDEPDNQKKEKKQDEEEQKSGKVVATCAECWKNLKFTTKDPYGHGRGFQCNMCEVVQHSSTGFWRCHENNYDLCKDCAQSVKDDLSKGVQVKCL